MVYLTEIAQFRSIFVKLLYCDRRYSFSSVVRSGHTYSEQSLSVMSSLILKCKIGNKKSKHRIKSSGSIYNVGFKSTSAETGNALHMYRIRTTFHYGSPITMLSRHKNAAGDPCLHDVSHDSSVLVKIMRRTTYLLLIIAEKHKVSI